MLNIFLQITCKQCGKQAQNLRSTPLAAIQIFYSGVIMRTVLILYFLKKQIHIIKYFLKQRQKVYRILPNYPFIQYHSPCLVFFKWRFDKLFSCLLGETAFCISLRMGHKKQDTLDIYLNWVQNSHLAIFYPKFVLAHLASLRLSE